MPDRKAHNLPSNTLPGVFTLTSLHNLKPQTKLMLIFKQDAEKK